MQIHRLFEIVYILMEQGTATAGQLASRFEVSPRTIYRDIDVLSGAGIPVYASKGKGGGIRLMEAFVLDKSLLSANEQNEILFALQSLKVSEAVDCGDVLSRLSGLFRKEKIDWIEMDFSGWGTGSEGQHIFNALKTGILDRRIVSFDYHNSRGESGRRAVEPAKLQFKHGSWYMQGFCRIKNGMRIFKISRMDNVKLSDEVFTEQRPVISLDSLEHGKNKQVALELLFSEEAAWYVYDGFRGCPVRKNEDGSFTVSVQVPEDQWVYSWLLSFGEGVRVLSPASVREKLRDRAAQIVSFYS